MIPILRQEGRAEPGRRIDGTKGFESDRGVVIYRDCAYDLQEVEQLICTKVSRSGVKPVEQLFVGHQALRGGHTDTYALVFYSKVVSISEPNYYNTPSGGQSELWQIVGDASCEYYLRYMATHVRGCNKLIYLLATYKDMTKAVLCHWKVLFINILTGPKDECVTNWICDASDQIPDQQAWAKYMKEGCSEGWPCDWEYRILSTPEQLIDLIDDIDHNSRTGWTRFGIILIVTADLQHCEDLYQHVHELTTRNDGLPTYQYVWVLCSFLPDSQLMRSGRWRVLQVDRTIADLSPSKRVVAKTKRRAAYNTQLLTYQSRTSFTLSRLQEACLSYSTIVGKEEEVQLEAEASELKTRAIETVSMVKSLPPVSVSSACSIIAMKKVWKIGDVRTITDNEVAIIEHTTQLPERQNVDWYDIPNNGYDVYDPTNCNVTNWDFIHYCIPHAFYVELLTREHDQLGISSEQVAMAEQDHQQLLMLITPHARCYIARQYYLSRTEIHRSTLSLILDTELFWNYIRLEKRNDELSDLIQYSRQPGITYIR